MNTSVIANWSPGRDIRAFSDGGHLIMVVGSARELAGVPRREWLSGDMVRLHLRAMVDTEGERRDLRELHGRLVSWSFFPDDATRVGDIADLVTSGAARAVMIGTSQLSAAERAELLPGDADYMGRMQAVLAHLPAKVGPAAWAEIERAFTLQTLAITLIAIAIAISSGIGALVVLGAGLVLVGWSIFDAIGKIVEFCELFMVADTPREQERCAELLAAAIAAAGVGAVIALLTRGGARAAQLRRGRGAHAPAAPRPRDPVNATTDPRERARPVRPEPQPARPVPPPARPGARLGSSTSTDYRRTFLAAHPELEGRVVVHHAIEQKVLTRYPGVVTPSQIHSLENLRGIPISENSTMHLSEIRRAWNQFYRANANPTQQQLLDMATRIDRQFGSRFVPPVGQ